MVVTRSVLIHVEDKASAFAAFHRVLRPAAGVRVLDSNRSQKNDPSDVRSVAIVALRQTRAWSGLRITWRSIGSENVDRYR